MLTQLLLIEELQTDLLEVLRWVMGGGAAVLAVMLVSWLAERYAPFQALAADVKRLVMICVALALGLGAWAVLKYVPPELLATLQEPFAVIATLIATVLGSQAWHAFVNRPLSGENGQRPQNL
jgi:uncharacterized integral membrane protein